MARLLMPMLFVLFTAPLCAQDFQLKGEDNSFRADLVRLDGDTVTYRRGTRENTAHLDDFVPASAFAIKRNFTGPEPESRLELARFALHRGLFADAAEVASAIEGGDSAREARGVADVARVLEADRLLAQAEAALDELDVATARPLLVKIGNEYADTPAAAKAEVLHGSLRHVEIAARARELEQAARDAQAEADESQADKRKPVDDWLKELQAQIDEVRALKEEADRDCRNNEVVKGLPKYEDAVEALKDVREAITGNRDMLKFPGQAETADELDDSAHGLIVDCYHPWSLYLYRMGRYRPAGSICDHGLRMDPKDTRLLGLRATIDEAYDPLED